MPLEEEGYADPDDRLGEVNVAALLTVLMLLAACIVPAAGAQDEAAAQRDLLQRRAAVEQKLKLAESMLFRSAGARRVAASEHGEALRLLAEARAAFASSRAALDRGELGVADELAAESLRQVGVAVRLVPEGGSDAEQMRARYARLLDAVQTFQASQIRSAGSANVAPPEMDRLRELVRQAQGLAEKGDFPEAARTMDQATELILQSASRLMVAPRGAGLSGAAALEAAGARYLAYEDLVGIAALRPNLAPERARALRVALDRARALNIRAQDLALSQRQDEAMTAELDAIEVLQEALRAVGVVSLK